jgi:hypothetical protein
MSQQTLKDLLEPPFRYGGAYKWDWETYHIRADMDGRETAILKVMPIADHGYYVRLLGDEGWTEFIKDLTEFTAAALNEKWKRDFGEPDCWLIEGAFLVCPKCGDYHPKDKWKISANYCPHCGKRLKLPPEEKRE